MGSSGAAAGGGVTDHGVLTGLTDDDHTQYPLKALLTTPGRGYAFDGSTVVQGNPSALRDMGMRRTGALIESIGRHESLVNNTVLSSGALYLYELPLPKGLTITSITFVSSVTGATSPTNQWFGLFDSSRVCLRLTSDDLTTAWAGNTEKTLNLTSQHVTTYEGAHYVGIMVKASTVPNLASVAVPAAVRSLAPVVAGSADTGQTTPPALPFTAAVLTGSAFYPYFYVS